MTPEQFAQAGSDSDAAAHFCLSAVRALTEGRFPAWWADVWVGNGFAEAFGVGRGWLQRVGQRIEDALRVLEGREERLLELGKELARECFQGPYFEAAAYLITEVIAPLQAHTIREQVICGRLPVSNGARAFGAAKEAIRRGLEEARKAGVEVNVGDVDLQAVAELVSRHVLRGEGISVTDALIAIHDHTRTISLAEHLAEAPTQH